MTLSLSELFDLQDQAKGANLAADTRVQELIDIIDPAVRLAIAILSGTTFQAAKQLVATVNRFLIDRGIFPAAKNPRSKKH